MEPKLPAPSIESGRTAFEHGQNVEVPASQEVSSPTFEVEGRPVEQRGEAKPATSSVPPVLPSPVAAPVLPAKPGDDAVAAITDDDGTLVAKDDDLIEKEWVDKAKKIIAETKDDPHRREREVGILQADYLRKRYGKELGAPD